MLIELNSNDVNFLETSLDNNFDATPLPSNNLDDAIWMTCLVNEDNCRFIISHTAKSWSTKNSRTATSELVGLLDRRKYALRHILDLCRKKLSKNESKNTNLSFEQEYTTTSKSLFFGEEYNDIVRFISSYHAGDTILLQDQNTKIISTKYDERKLQYSTLEFLLGADGEKSSPLLYLLAIFAGTNKNQKNQEMISLWAPTLHEIVNRPTQRRGKIKYQIITALAKGIFEDIIDNDNQFTPEVPRYDWSFPWGSLSEMRRYFSAVQTIAIYHLLSIHFGAGRLGIEGVGLDQICLQSDRKKFIRDITRISDLPSSVVDASTTALTYGNGMRTPDPALQPFIPIRDNLLALPGSVVISSNWVRNMLSLHARLDSRSFDANSSVFERSMIEKLSADLPERFEHRSSVHVPTLNGSEEVDLVLIDHATHTILLGELRWMLQPGDAREVLTRRKVVRQKVDQAYRKTAAVRANIGAALSHLSLPTGAWRIEGIVILEGYGGTTSQTPNEIPVVPLKVFMAAVHKFNDLNHLHATLSSPLWLPRRNFDYIWTEIEAEYFGETFIRPGFKIGNRSYTNTSLGIYFSEALLRQPDDLRSMPW